MKRLFDLCISALAILLLGPLLVAVAIASWISMGRPILFRQVRPGLNAKPFVLIKFRTMREVIDANGEPLADAIRLTPLGAFLRRTSIDELPELWNVLKGEMSLVGPRPLLSEYLPLYSSIHSRRHEVRPGITGWAQINGRNAISWQQKLDLDVWYVDHRTLWLDLRILAISIVKVFTAEGIAQQGHATVEKYRGSAE